MIPFALLYLIGKREWYQKENLDYDILPRRRELLMMLQLSCRDISTFAFCRIGCLDFLENI